MAMWSSPTGSTRLITSTFIATSSAPQYKDDFAKTVNASSDTNQNCNADFRSAGTFITVNSHRLPRLLHDVTRTRLSDAAFQAIKQSGKLNLRYMDIWNVRDGVQPEYESGTLTRVERERRGLSHDRQRSTGDSARDPPYGNI